MRRALANRCLILVALLPLAAVTQSSAQVESCTHLSDGRERLACFDREVAAQMAREGRSPPKLTEEQKMGLTPARIEQLQRAPGSAAPLKKLTVTIQNVAVDGNGYQVFTLTNGQIWRQVELDTRFSVHTADSVVISRGVGGSYFMSFGKHVDTRVSRLH